MLRLSQKYDNESITWSRERWQNQVRQRDQRNEQIAYEQLAMKNEKNLYIDTHYHPDLPNTFFDFYRQLRSSEL